jgi:hypothetical protein
MTEHLSEQQLARMEAVKVASVAADETSDIVDLAEYIINGTHPMDRYGDAPNVHDA